MKKKEIHFIIDTSGQITSTVKGIKGSSCSSVTDAFKTLGEVVSKERTSEYFEKENTKNFVYGSTGKADS